MVTSSTATMTRRVSLVVLWTLASAAVAAIAYRKGLNNGETAQGGSRGVDGLVEDFRTRGEEEDGEIGDNSEGGAAVERVLSLWFDGSTADNHRTKWFAQVSFGCSSLLVRYHNMTAVLGCSLSVL